MARRRRPHDPDAEREAVRDIAVTSHDRVDPRVYLLVPSIIANDPDSVFAWALDHAPGSVLAEGAAEHSPANRERIPSR